MSHDFILLLTIKQLHMNINQSKISVYIHMCTLICCLLFYFRMEQLEDVEVQNTKLSKLLQQKDGKLLEMEDKYD